MRIARFDPSLGIDRKLPHCLQQTLGIRIGYAARKIILTAVAFHSAAIEIGGQGRKGRISRFQRQKRVTVPADRSGR